MSGSAPSFVTEKLSSVLRSHYILSEGDSRKDARAVVSDQQMRSSEPSYPVDRYLVQSSKQIEMVNIIDDDIWNPEPGLRPEDEILLRKLHEMLQSTAEDLKLLSGQLSKFHEPGVQVKTMPTPLDKEFNEKVHIEEVVNAKFHGYNLVDNLSQQSLPKQENIVSNVDSETKNLRGDNKSKQADGVKRLQTSVQSKNLGISRTKIFQINGADNIGFKDNSTKTQNLNKKKSVAYNEFCYKHVEPKIKESRTKLFQIQNMPSINIRRELKEQEVLHLDIIPNDSDIQRDADVKRNVSLVSVYHETVEPITKTTPFPSHLNHFSQFKHTTRKISKMSTCESSESANNVSSDTQFKLKTQKQIKKVIQASPKNSTRNDLSENKKKFSKDTAKRTHLQLDHWKKKLNAVYGQSSGSKSFKNGSLNKDKIKSSLKSSTSSRKTHAQAVLNNNEYIPYSKLTIGGVKVSDIEREISRARNKHDTPLSPMLDKILSNRENSFDNESSQKKKNLDGLKFLTTSDENLLQEVIDIEKTVSETLSNKFKNNFTNASRKKVSSENDTENDSYVDDFEDEKSDHTLHSENHSVENVNVNLDPSDHEEPTNDAKKYESQPKESRTDIHNTTYTKVSNLSFKNAVDVFEYVHLIDTQDIATQSNSTSKISLKETQTSPRNDQSTIQPIHNDLWPSIDTSGDVEKMFKLEKDFIKKFIIEEYGDLLEKNLTKASTSKYNEDLYDMGRNVNASQKITQTSPARVKSVMTSPRHSKTRTTSPLAMSFNVDHQTSIQLFSTHEESKKKTHEAGDDITANLSSSRFSLRLPQTSREVLTNFGTTIHTPSKNDKAADENAEHNTTTFKTFRKFSSSSSSSVDGDVSSSDISSLGEFKPKGTLLKSRNSKISESSSTSTISKNSSDIISNNSGIIPLRSEGEISIKRNTIINKTSKSEGEISFKLH